MKFSDNLEVFFHNSLIVEFSRVFGKEATEKLISVFGGMSIKVPSVKHIQTMERDIAVFKILQVAKGDVQRLSYFKGHVQAKFGIKKKEVDIIYKKMTRSWKLYQIAKAKDMAVNKHKRLKLK